MPEEIQIPWDVDHFAIGGEVEDGVVLGVVVVVVYDSEQAGRSEAAQEAAGVDERRGFGEEGGI